MRLQFIQNAAGAILSPFDSWLVMRGIKALPRIAFVHVITVNFLGMLARIDAQNRSEWQPYTNSTDAHNRQTSRVHRAAESC